MASEAQRQRGALIDGAIELRDRFVSEAGHVADHGARVATEGVHLAGEALPKRWFMPNNVVPKWRMSAWACWLILFALPMYQLYKIAREFSLVSPPIENQQEVADAIEWPTLHLCPYVTEGLDVVHIDYEVNMGGEKQAAVRALAECGNESFADFNPNPQNPDLFRPSQCAIVKPNTSAVFTKEQSHDFPRMVWVRAVWKFKDPRDAVGRDYDFEVQAFAGSTTIGIISGYNSNDTWGLYPQFHLAKFVYKQSDFWCHEQVTKVPCKRGWERVVFGEEQDVFRHREDLSNDLVRFSKDAFERWIGTKGCAPFGEDYREDGTVYYMAYAAFTMYHPIVTQLTIMNFGDRIVNQGGALWGFFDLVGVIFLLIFVTRSPPTQTDDELLEPLVHRYFDSEGAMCACSKSGADPMEEGSSITNDCDESEHARA